MREAAFDIIVPFWQERKLVNFDHIVDWSDWGGRNTIASLRFLKPRLMLSCATIIIPLYDCVIFISSLHGAELSCWFSKVAQTFDAITGSQFRVRTRGPIERWTLGAI